ncbi:MAG TPA: class I mannose-6-phosphate isomerase [Gemmatales bacterium]|nr:class I mannose-6-phosphate isomerase [Gemmatales bacterium]HMP60140.1 class I mannose-6-phosphate isomerase [Gemmatales bacterium]
MVTPLHPLLFTPDPRPMPWGGQRLASWLGMPDSGEPIGEAWLLSDHPRHASVVAHGPLRGMTLAQLLAERAPELVGRRCERFPLLIKLLDAQENLSIQVHPDDLLARQWAPGEGGKTEAWIVLEAAPSSAIYLGLRPGIDRAALERELHTGAVPLCLVRHEPRPGQCYFVPAGSVHALGGGTVVLEVQQTSDATFRLYDWGRVDAQGRPRPLHWEAGLACLKEQPEGAGLQSPRTEASGAELLVACRHFELRRWTGPRTWEPSGPTLFVVEKGTMTLNDPTLGDLTLNRSQTVLIPAACDPPQAVLPTAGCAAIEIRWE